MAGSREEAIRQARPFLEVKYKTYREWGQDKVMPAGDDFDHGFDELLEDRFLIGSLSLSAFKIFLGQIKLLDGHEDIGSFE